MHLGLGWRWRLQGVGAALLLAASVVPVPAFQAGSAWEELEAKGAVIAGIEVRIQDVFDTSKPDERHWVARAANFVHIETRKSVVARELLFKAGEKVDARLIHETERNLRELEFVRDASIVPEGEADGTVWARVEVKDAWSLKGGLKYGHVGGQTTWRFRVHEVNLLGFGKQLILGHQEDPERTTDEIAYADPQLFGSHWTLQANYQKLSDGKGKLLRVERPYYALDVPWSLGAEAASQESILTLYDRGQAVFSVPDRLTSASLYYSRACALRDRTAFRLGAEFRVGQARYGALSILRAGWLPEPDLRDRRLRGLAVTWSVAQDRFQSYENMAKVSRVEDYNLGWFADVSLGFFSTALGSSENAPFGDFKVAKGWLATPRTLLLLDAQGQGRRPASGWEGVLSTGSLTLYDQHLPWQTLAANLTMDAALRPDPEQWLYLGGPEGLRGYDSWMAAGDRRWVFSVEDRVVTPWRLWGLAQVGFVAYADAGAIRTFDTGSWTRTYADVGLGLRFGNLKSAFGSVFVLTVAVPLVKQPGVDSYQIVVGNVVRF
jgi:hypothetical protein